jgi:hypothetical protein
MLTQVSDAGEAPRGLSAHPAASSCPTSAPPPNASSARSPPARAAADGPGLLPAIERLSEIPAWRIKSATGTPASACFTIVTICSTENRLRLKANLPSWSFDFAGNSLLRLDQKSRGRSRPLGYDYHEWGDDREGFVVQEHRGAEEGKTVETSTRYPMI